MKNFVTYLKALMIAALIWIGVYVSTMGALTAGFTFSLILLVVGLVLLFIGVLMAASLLQRSNDKWLRGLLVLLLSVGTVIALRAMEGVHWTKGF